MNTPAPRAPAGLRELKKQRTRAGIASTALELFLARGFDDVTVAEIARAAEVSEATVFNYFRTKEDLVFHRLEGFWTNLIGAVEHRPEGEGVVSAVEGFLLGSEPTALAPEREKQVADINRMIAASPALRAREAASYDQAASALAEVIAATTSLRDDAAAAAQMILGVHRSLVAYTREQVLAGANGKTLARRTAARTRSGYALLRQGLDL